MEKKTPLQIENMQVCALNESEWHKFITNPREITFDNRRDLLIDEQFSYVTVSIDLVNTRRFWGTNNRGVRRTLAVTLVDMTERFEISTLDLKVNIPREETYLTVYASFGHREVNFQHNHAYKMLVSDKLTDENISSLIFHTYGQEELGHPFNWYTVCHGGIRPDDSDQLYRSVDVAPHTDLNLRFNLEHNFESKAPAILPELEIRLYRPESGEVSVRFVEPHLFEGDMPMCDVEMEFMSMILERGVYYAELLCMEYPIGGFVFRTNGPEIHDIWFGQGMEPLGEYSLKAAEYRFMRLVTTEPGQTKPCEEDDEFDHLLDEFINSQLEEIANEKSTIADEEDSLPCDDTTEEESVGERESPDSDQPACETSEQPSLEVSLEHLTGLRSTKEKLAKYEKLVKFNKMRADAGLPTTTLPLHAMFLGAPGTGKTTVAKLMGSMLHRAGLLSSGHVIVRERATLLGQNYASESENTIKALQEAEGGILFIDEAYQLYQPNDPRDPGKFVIESLLTALANDSNRDWMLILAGYPDRMRQMFEMNPGFKSRIPDTNIYTFENFSEAELLEIATNYLSRNGYTLSDNALQALTVRLNSDIVNADNTFGNARHVINLIEADILPAMAVRIIDNEISDTKLLSLIEASDIPAPVLAISKEGEKNQRRPIGFRA